MTGKILIVILSIIPQIALAECSAYAEPSGPARVTSKGDTYVAFKVTGKPCGKGCSGWVDYKIHVLNRNGRDTGYSQKVKWRSRAGEPVRVSEDGYYGHCRDSKLGPCEVQHVEVRRVSCRD